MSSIAYYWKVEGDVFKDGKLWWVFFIEPKDFARFQSVSSKLQPVQRKYISSVDKWFVRDDAVEKLKKRLKLFKIDSLNFKKIEIDYGKISSDKDPSASDVTLSYSVLYIQEDAPKEVVDAAYKALMLKNHPDRGGDVEKTVRINNALESIYRSKGWVRKK
jgi:hypothetical protein